MEEGPARHLTHLFRFVFPPQARIQAVERDGSCLFSVSWRLGEQYTENWSKEIRIAIPPEAMARYGKLNEKGRNKANGNLVAFLQEKLSNFDPRHDTPRYRLPPVETWEVRFEDIFPGAP